MEWKSVREYHAQFLYTLSSYPKAVRFTQTNKLWEGFWRYGWVSRLLVVLAVVAGLKFLSLIFNWFQQVDTSIKLNKPNATKNIQKILVHADIQS